MARSIIDGRQYYDDIYKLMNDNGDLIQKNGVWQPNSSLNCIYLFRQMPIKDDIIYKYFDIKNTQEIPNVIISESDPEKRNFGEVVTYGELYCIISPPKDEYTNFSVVMDTVLRKYVSNKITRITHTKYVSNRMDLEYYIFRITTSLGHYLYWTLDDMKRIIDAVCYHIDHIHGQHSGIYQQVDDYTLKIPFQTDIYVNMQHMMLPGCVNIEKRMNAYTVKEANSSLCISVDNNRANWEKGTLNPDIPFYVHGIAMSSKELFEAVMSKYGLQITDQAPWLGEYYVTTEVCPISGKYQCQSKIRLTSRDIKLYCKCDEKYKILHTFEISQTKNTNIEVETFDDYLNLNHHSTRYVDALIALKRVLIYDIGARKIAIKKRNDSTLDIYWEYWEDGEFFSYYTRKVKNHKGEFTTLKLVIEYQAHEFKTRIVWVPYSWKYKPSDFNNYVECVNQYPTPREPKLEVYPDKFQLELIDKLFAGDAQEAYAFILLIAKIVQKPHSRKKFHIILRNAGSNTIIKMFTTLFTKEIVHFTSIENLDQVPQCIVCIIENYSRVNENQKIKTKTTDFFNKRVFNTPNPHNNCYVISLYHDTGIPVKQKKEFYSEVLINMNHTYDAINTDGAYEYILSIDKSEYKGIENNLAKRGFVEEFKKSIPALTTSSDPTSIYFDVIFQHRRSSISCGKVYPVDIVYTDYTEYMDSIKCTAVGKCKFGQMAKSRGIERRQYREDGKRLYKYNIPAKDTGC